MLPVVILLFPDGHLTRRWRVVLWAYVVAATVFAAADKFPTKPKFLNDICADEQGTLYVSDSGDLKGADGAVFRISPDGKRFATTTGRTVSSWDRAGDKPLSQFETPGDTLAALAK